MLNKSKIIFFLAVFFVSSLCALSQTNVWTPCGPEGASMSGLVIDPGNPLILYAATKTGGVYKSVDGAATWNTINEGFPYLSFDGIVINPKTPSTLYVWSGLSANAGVYKTTDSGSTWTLTGLSDPVYSLAIDPQTPSNLYVVLSSYTAAMKSSDGGATWTEIADGFASPGFFVVDPNNSSVVYLEENDLGLFKSTDGGVSWNPTGLAGSPPVDFIPHWEAVAIDPHNSLIIYAGGWNNGDLWKSIDGGAHFASIKSFGLILGRVWLDPNSPGTIYASYGRLVKSADGGETWTDPLGTGQPPSVLSLALDPISSLNLYIGAQYMGVYKSVDSGNSWQVSNTNMRATPVYKLAIDPHAESTIYAGTLGAGIYKSLDAGASWEKYNNGIPETSFMINSLAINPQNTSVVYAGTQAKIYDQGPISKGGVYRTVNGGASWTAINTGLPRGKDDTWVVVVDPQNPSTVYAGSSLSIYKSINGGNNWTDIKGNLIYRIAAIAIDPQTSTTLYIGANSMNHTTLYGVFKSPDGGATWIQTGLVQQNIRAVAIAPLTPSIVYAVTMNNGIYKSTNSGDNWGQINNGISGTPNSSFIIDQDSPATLYVGTDQGGVFKSENGGASWTSINNNLVASRIWSLCLARQESGAMSPSIRKPGLFGQGVLSKNYLPVAAQETRRLYSSASADGSIFYLDFALPPDTLTISGKVTDGPNPVQNVTVTFSHDGHTESTAANGTYSYTVPRGTTTTVTPSHAAYPSWTPSSRTITNITADQPNQDFQGTPIMYRISGTVTDGTNPVGGVTITFSFYGHTETTAADGTYSYNVPPYSSTIITPSKTGYGSWTPAVCVLAHITSDEPNQDFQGTNLTAPRMTLVQGRTMIPKGGTYDYSMQMVNAGSQAVFTINNTGPSDLTLQTNLVISGANADQFSVIQAPTSPVAPNQSTTFIIEFKATSVGQKTASISLLNNDPVNNPYDLNLQGKGETSLAFVYSGSWTGAGKAGAGWFIGDFNGDGKKDIFRYYPGVSGADMFLSDGTKFNSVGSWTGAGYGSNGWYVGDFNGDGKDDIFRYYPGVSGADMFLSDGTQFNSVGSWTGAGNGSDGWYVGDFNGDGKDDIMRYTPGVGSEVFLSDGTQFVSAGIWTGAGNGSDGWYVGDFNGDGKDDIMRYIPGVGSEVFLSYGTQFVSAGIWTGAGNGTDGWYVGDFNGDGKDDIMRYIPGIGSEVFLSYGTQFVSAGIWTGAGNGADGWYVGDFNGDGMDDIFRYLPGVSGADVFLAGSVSGSVSEFDVFQSNASSSVGILFDAAYWRMEEKWLEPFRQKAARGELVSLMDLKQAYENATGGKPTRAVLLRWLKKHDFRLISKE